MTTWTVSEARAALAEILDRVSAGEEVTVTRHGQPVAVVVRPDALSARRADTVLADAAALRTRLERARQSGRPDKGLSRARADELVTEIRAARDR